MRIIITIIAIIMLIQVYGEGYIFRDYRYYDYIEYFIRSGKLDINRYNDIPILKSEILEGLRIIEDSIENNDRYLSKEERYIYDILKRDIDRGFYYRDRLGLKIRYDDSIGYSIKSRLRVGIEIGDIAIESGIESDIPYDGNEEIDTIRHKYWNNTSTEMDRGIIGYNWGNSNYIIIGRFLSAFGQGLYDNMFISRELFSMDGLLFRIGDNRWEFKYMFVSLDPSHIDYRYDSIKRYASFHKISFSLPYKTYFSFKEVALYTAPMPELYYLNPFLNYYGVQNNIVADDNIIWSLEFINRYIGNIPITLEIFIDDFQYDFKTDIAPNKIGILLNTTYTRDRLQIGYEYVRITKWTGTHTVLENAYMYYNKPMFYYISCDSDIFNVFAKYFINKFEFSSRFYYYRKGEGTLTQPFMLYQETAITPFPSGIVERRMAMELNIGIIINKTFNIEMNFEYANIKNENNIINNDNNKFNITFTGVVFL